MKYIIYSNLILLVICLNTFSQTKEMKFDMKYQIERNDFILVNDTLNHKIGIASGTGSAMFSDQTSAYVQAYFIYDYVNGNGDFIEYYTITLQDSSTLTIQAKGKSMGSTDESAPLFSANLIVTGGTGIYTGYTGQGSMTGNRKHILEDGSIVKLSFSVTIKK